MCNSCQVHVRTCATNRSSYAPGCNFQLEILLIYYCAWVYEWWNLDLYSWKPLVQCKCNLQNSCSLKGKRFSSLVPMADPTLNEEKALERFFGLAHHHVITHAPIQTCKKNRVIAKLAEPRIGAIVPRPFPSSCV